MVKGGAWLLERVTRMAEESHSLDLGCVQTSLTEEWWQVVVQKLSS